MLLHNHIRTDNILSKGIVQSHLDLKGLHFTNDSLSHRPTRANDPQIMNDLQFRVVTYEKEGLWIISIRLIPDARQLEQFHLSNLRLLMADRRLLALDHLRHFLPFEGNLNLLNLLVI